MLKRRTVRAPKSILALSLVFTSAFAFAQDNSPYSRFGLGDLVPSTNITTRGMGSISAAYIDYTSINFNNPASYASFLALREARSKKLQYGRVILDVGINESNRNLIVPNTTSKFASSDFLFSYLQVGLPLRRNWGLSFGLRPVSRISYDVSRTEMLIDPSTNLPVDSANTRFKGSGGSYLPSIGTGFGFKLSNKVTAQRKDSSSISFGGTIGYLFGNRETKTLRNLFNDTVTYYAANYQVNSSFGGLFYNAGMQYHFESRNNAKKQTTLFRIGLSGNWQQKINASQDVLRETYTLGNAGEELQIDSVFQKDNIKGKLIYPGTYKAGFVVQQYKDNQSGWLAGIDYSKGKWASYRFFNQRDSLKDSWMVNVGTQFNPRPKSAYFSNVTYRFGTFVGEDYVDVKGKLPVLGFTFGMGLPIPNYNRLSLNQRSMVNLAFEYAKRGNNDNVLKENIFRISLGLNFSDLWFGKKKYD